MVHIFKYAILMAIPDARRGERVNVGMIVFLADRVDVHLSDVAKISALAGGDWKPYVRDVSRRLVQFESGAQAEEAIRLNRKIDPIITASEIATFSVDHLDQYYSRIKEILDTLVVRPKLDQAKKETRINTEISRHLRKIKVLAKSNETINDHRVVRDFYISKDEELVADFALKNGSMHVMATLDLRKANARIDEAALKAVTLDKAKSVYKRRVNRYAVYAATEGHEHCQPHIKLLSEYSDRAFNWLVQNEKNAIVGLLQQAAAPPFSFGDHARGRR